MRNRASSGANNLGDWEGASDRRPAAPILAVLAGWLASAAARAGERCHLAELEPRMLRDIGITPFERELETRKWWWQW
jgi:uncharacterized protein YjiS (DUF1127 family)